MSGFFVSRSRTAGLCLGLLVGLVGCEGSPVASEPELVVVKGVAVQHDDGLELRLLRYSESWYPRDDALRPEPGEVFMTFLVEVRNGGTDIVSSSPNDFALRTFEGTRHEGPVWVPHPVGREPVLSGATLAPGASVEGWLTFHVPELAHLDELLWQPANDVIYAINLPPPHPIRRWGEALVFGRVQDPAGEPLSDAKILITTFSVIPANPNQRTTVGECTGNLLTTWETKTGEDGWYEQLLSAVHVDLMCVDVQVIPARETGFPSARAAGTVRLGLPIPMIEPPEVRVDLTVSPEAGA